MLPVDKRPFPDTVSPAVIEAVAKAVAARATPAYHAIEALLALQESGVVFDRPVTREAILRDHGQRDLDKHLAAIQRAPALLDLANDVGWRVSPLATLLTLGPRAMAGAPAKFGDHLKLMSDAVVRAMKGTGKKRIAAAVPYRHSKSTLFSFSTPLWYLGQRPDHKVGICSHTSALSSMFGRLVRNAVDPARMGWSLSDDSQAAARWNTSVGGSLWTGSVESSIHGLGFNLGIVDDPYGSAEMALSKNYRDQVEEWFFSTFLSRGEDDPIIVLCMTRAHSEDLFATLKSGKIGDPALWEFITLPAIATRADELGRVEGEALWPAVRPIDALRTMRSGMSVEAWSTGYQQVPLDELATGKVYSQFDPAVHVRPIKRDPRAELLVSFDFNVGRMSCVIGQLRDESEEDHDAKLVWLLTGDRKQRIEILDEISIPDSTTAACVEELIERLRAYAQPGVKLRVTISGDASGAQRKTAAAGPNNVPVTDWDAVRGAFKRCDFASARLRVYSSNPGVNDRVNRVRGFLRAASGDVRFAIDPRCKGLIEDLKKVRWARDSFGNALSILDKRDPDRTHLSDALGYMVCATKGVRGTVGPRGGPPIM